MNQAPPRRTIILGDIWPLSEDRQRRQGGHCHLCGGRINLVAPLGEYTPIPNTCWVCGARDNLHEGDVWDGHSVLDWRPGPLT